MSINFHRYNDFKLLCLTIFGEAEGEGVIGQLAVGMVVRNRVREGTYGTGYRGVILKPKQFSCFNEDSPRANAMVEFIDKHQPSWLYDQIYWVAKGVIIEFVADDITEGSNHFLTLDLFSSDNRPKWADDRKVKQIIGNHVFLKL